MPSPIDRNPHPFNPKKLRLSVIAVPLRETIEHELAETGPVRKKYGALLKNQNTLIFYRKGLPRSMDLRKVIQHRLKEAVAEAGKATRQKIGPPKFIPDPVSAAQLSGEVIRLLEAIDAASREPVIDRIWPRRFDVII